jgi:DNA-binding response OmpR family regulator
MRLRDKLGDPAELPGYVSTVRGVGYRFEGD